MKRPSMQFYPGDWLHDAALRVVSVAARGAWIDMLCIMHQADPYGYLKVNGKVILTANLARILGATLQETEGYLSELSDAGVFASDESGCIFSRRMIRDEELRQVRAAGGKLGGNPKLKHGNQRLTSRLTSEVNQNTTPSSSSSSSEQDQKKKQDQKSLRTACASASELLADVSPDVARDFAELRKKKRAPLTATAVNGIRREATKAGLTLEAALAICCERGWTGFRADWDWRASIRAGPMAGATSKAGQAIEILEGMKGGRKNFDSGADAAVIVPRIGSAAGR